MSLPFTQIGSYRILRLLGAGGMGQVYEAVHEVIERHVAIKLLSPDYARDQMVTDRLFNEARAVNRIEHPSLVQISDYGHTPDGAAYLVMELLRGEPLSARLKKSLAAQERLPLRQVLQIAWQIADAMAAAHDKEIIHRDLKPDNLMLVKDPVAPGGERVKILDFGIAKLALSGSQKTDTNLVMGTPIYMSPEQCRGAGGVDDRTDVYALGVILYRMIAGQPPFVADGAGELIGCHLFMEPPPLAARAPDVSPELALLVHRLLIKDKSARPSMRETATEVERLQSWLPNAVMPHRGSAHGAPATALAIAAMAPDSVSTMSSIGRKTKYRPLAFRLVPALGVGILIAGILILGLRVLWPRPPAQPPVPSSVTTLPAVVDPVPTAGPRLAVPVTGTSVRSPLPASDQSNPAPPATKQTAPSPNPSPILRRGSSRDTKPNQIDSPKKSSLPPRNSSDYEE